MNTRNLVGYCLKVVLYINNTSMKKRVYSGPSFFSNPPVKRKVKMKVAQLFLTFEAKSLSRVQLFVVPWTVAYKAPLSIEFSRKEYWSGLPFPSPGDLPHPGIEPRSPTLQADALLSEAPRKPPVIHTFPFNNCFFILSSFEWTLYHSLTSSQPPKTSRLY